ncbi:hypothetical protein HK104_009713 [Borealophlyctis nickersoniae]|nr:hypothetical protein HK104_009713 [Borealophlyctis nickersoniae]
MAHTFKMKEHLPITMIVHDGLSQHNADIARLIEGKLAVYEAATTIESAAIRYRRILQSASERNATCDSDENDITYGVISSIHVIARAVSVLSENSNHGQPEPTDLATASAAGQGPTHSSVNSVLSFRHLEDCNLIPSVTLLLTSPTFTSSPDTYRRLLAAVADLCSNLLRKREGLMYLASQFAVSVREGDEDMDFANVHGKGGSLEIWNRVFSSEYEFDSGESGVWSHDAFVREAPGIFDLFEYVPFDGLVQSYVTGKFSEKFRLRHERSRLFDDWERDLHIRSLGEWKVRQCSLENLEGRQVTLILDYHLRALRAVQQLMECAHSAMKEVDGRLGTADQSGNLKSRVWENLEALVKLTHCNVGRQAVGSVLTLLNTLPVLLQHPEWGDPHYAPLISILASAALRAPGSTAALLDLFTEHPVSHAQWANLGAAALSSIEPIRNFVEQGIKGTLTSIVSPITIRNMEDTNELAKLFSCLRILLRCSFVEEELGKMASYVNDIDFVESGNVLAEVGILPQLVRLIERGGEILRKNVELTGQEHKSVREQPVSEAGNAGSTADSTTGYHTVVVPSETIALRKAVLDVLDVAVRLLRRLVLTWYDVREASLAAVRPTPIPTAQGIDNDLVPLMTDPTNVYLKRRSTEAPMRQTSPLFQIPIIGLKLLNSLDYLDPCSMLSPYILQSGAGIGSDQSHHMLSIGRVKEGMMSLLEDLTSIVAVDSWTAKPEESAFGLGGICYTDSSSGTGGPNTMLRPRFGHPASVFVKSILETMLQVDTRMLSTGIRILNELLPVTLPVQYSGHDDNSDSDPEDRKQLERNARQLRTYWCRQLQPLRLDLVRLTKIVGLTSSKSLHNALRVLLMQIVDLDVQNVGLALTLVATLVEETRQRYNVMKEWKESADADTNAAHHPKFEQDCIVLARWLSLLAGVSSLSSGASVLVHLNAEQGRVINILLGIIQLIGRSSCAVDLSFEILCATLSAATTIVPENSERSVIPADEIPNRVIRKKTAVAVHRHIDLSNEELTPVLDLLFQIALKQEDPRIERKALSVLAFLTGTANGARAVVSSPALCDLAVKLLHRVPTLLESDLIGQSELELANLVFDVVCHVLDVDVARVLIGNLGVEERDALAQMLRVSMDKVRSWGGGGPPDVVSGNALDGVLSDLEFLVGALSDQAPSPVLNESAVAVDEEGVDQLVPQKRSLGEMLSDRLYVGPSESVAKKQFSLPPSPEPETNLLLFGNTESEANFAIFARDILPAFGFSKKFNIDAEHMKLADVQESALTPEQRRSHVHMLPPPPPTYHTPRQGFGVPSTTAVGPSDAAQRRTGQPDSGSSSGGAGGGGGGGAFYYRQYSKNEFRTIHANRKANTSRPPSVHVDMYEADRGGPEQGKPASSATQQQQQQQLQLQVPAPTPLPMRQKVVRRGVGMGPPYGTVPRHLGVGVGGGGGQWDEWAEMSALYGGGGGGGVGVPTPPLSSAVADAAEAQWHGHGPHAPPPPPPGGGVGVGGEMGYMYGGGWEFGEWPGMWSGRMPGHDYGG